MVTDVLDEAAIPYEIFSDVKPNPTVTNVKNGIEAYKKSGADFIIAIGGGSSIDTAKAVGIVINNPEFSDIVSLEGCAPTKNKSVPIVALPTTAGTAAETTINYVIIDEVNQKKMVCVDPQRHPCRSYRRCRAYVFTSRIAHSRYRHGRSNPRNRRLHHQGGMGAQRHV